MTVVSPLSVLPERACRGCVNGLGRIVSRGIGMRDDLVDGDGNFGAADGDGGDDDRRRRRLPPPVAVARNEDDDNGRRSGKGGWGGGICVRFHDDTKGGAAPHPP